MRHVHDKVRRLHWPTSRFLKKKAWRLISHPVFLILTICGNLLISCGAVALYLVEHGTNPHIKSLLDTIWWAVATVTTVGYGDISPVTVPGKIIGIFMMIFGTALFWSYTALFAEALMSEELDDFGSELRIIEKRLHALKKMQINQSQDSSKQLSRMETDLQDLQPRAKS